MSNRLAVLIATALVAAPAFACGPDFPEVLLDSRAATLSDLPEGVFTREARELVPQPPGGFKAVERADWVYTGEAPTRDAAEREMLGDAFERADAIRGQANAKAAYAAGEGLPEDARRYLAGAAAFDHDDPDEAARRFASVLDLPAAERTRYGVWAAYMLGRISTLEDGADKAFERVRALVAGGDSDPLGLAVDSYGEQARLHLDAGDDAAATALYAQQATFGSQFGIASLLEVARAIVRDPMRLARAVREPITRKLVAVYLMTRSGELETDPVDASAASAPAAATAIASFLDAVEKNGVDHVEGAGRLAALAYRSGRYDLAARLAAKDSDGLAAWARAKLALRAGDAAAAARAYAEASKAFPANDRAQAAYEDYTETPSSYCRVEGEAGTLALARGEYIDALEHLYAASPTFWMDAAFVAERVLTLDELAAFVTRHAATPIAPTLPDTPVTESVRRAGFLRALLARRLLRAERYDEAMGYFDDAELKKKAGDYAAARRAALSGGRIERAEHWFGAAKIAREDGLDLIGYELDPDDEFFGGNFQSYSTFGYGPPVEGAAPAPIATPLKIDAGPGAGERERLAASAAKPDLRFHYRYVAADFASRAADLVPNRSQAYAAMLCQATGWLMYRDPPAARVLYERYIKNGPYVPWAENFGTQCEEPDFDGAAKRLHAERIAAAKRIVRKALPYAFGGALIALIGSALLWRRRRARARS
jgi:hypothetical protein